MLTKLSKYLFYPAFIFHVFFMDAYCQSPSSPLLLSSPFEPHVTISAGVQRGWGSGNISDLNHWGVYSVADFIRYKIQFAVGITENENFKNTFSFNSGISVALGDRRGLWIFQPALFSGFGYTSIYTSNDENYDMLNIPIGFSLGFDGTVPFGDINISFSPKMQYRYVKLNDGEQSVGAGINIGILYTPIGKNLGIKIGFDFLNIKRVPLLESGIERSLLVGIEYVLK